MVVVDVKCVYMTMFEAELNRISLERRISNLFLEQQSFIVFDFLSKHCSHLNNMEMMNYFRKEL